MGTEDEFAHGHEIYKVSYGAEISVGLLLPPEVNQ
jgi:hypothetical protein